MPAVTLLQQLVQEPNRGIELGGHSELMASLEGVLRMLSHKHKSAATYLSKLEGQKGSDVSARQATKALVAVSSQLTALRMVLKATGVGEEGVVGPLQSDNMPRGKNTIVRSVLAELKTNVRAR